jgi:hypothetical protein
MMSQLSIPLYPIFIVAADIGLAGVLFVVAPVLGVLMATAALFVLAAVAFQAQRLDSFWLQPEVPRNG